MSISTQMSTGQRIRSRHAAVDHDPALRPRRPPTFATSPIASPLTVDVIDELVLVIRSGLAAGWSAASGTLSSSPQPLDVFNPLEPFETDVGRPFCTRSDAP